MIPLGIDWAWKMCQVLYVQHVYGALRTVVHNNDNAGSFPAYNHVARSECITEYSAGGLEHAAALSARNILRCRKMCSSGAAPPPKNQRKLAITETSGEGSLSSSFSLIVSFQDRPTPALHWPPPEVAQRSANPPPRHKRTPRGRTGLCERERGIDCPCSNPLRGISQPWLHSHPSVPP